MSSTQQVFGSSESYYQIKRMIDSLSWSERERLKREINVEHTFEQSNHDAGQKNPAMCPIFTKNWKFQQLLKPRMRQCDLASYSQTHVSYCVHRFQSFGAKGLAEYSKLGQSNAAKSFLSLLVARIYRSGRTSTASTSHLLSKSDSTV